MGRQLPCSPSLPHLSCLTEVIIWLDVLPLETDGGFSLQVSPASQSPGWILSMSQLKTKKLKPDNTFKL